jgi:hypothetical protein
MPRQNVLYPGLATLLFAAATAALVIAEPFRTRQPYPDAVPVIAAEVDGRIRVDWNPSHPVVAQAERAVLRVRDGESAYEYPVEKSILQRGGLDYLRKSGDVSLSLVLVRGGREQGQGSVRAFAVPAPSAPQAAAADTR